MGVMGITGCGNEKSDVVKPEKVQEEENQKQAETQNKEEQQHGKENQQKEETEIEEGNKKKQFAITREVYEEGEIHIEYPQVENLVNQDITEWYNEQFKSSIDVYTGEVEEGDLAEGSETVEETFQVTYQSEDMISILIEGYFYAEGAAHPYSYKSSYNINLKTGESMSITDEYSPEEIVDDLLAGQNYTVIKDAKTMEVMTGEEQDAAFQEITTKDRAFMLESMKNCDYDFKSGADGKMLQGEDIVYAYSVRLSDGKWAICTDVSHALGDYIIIRYDK